MTRTEIITCYKQAGPLRRSHSAFKKHVRMLQVCRNYDVTYDDFIAEARRVYARDAVDKAWKRQPRPPGVGKAEWAARKPTVADVDAVTPDRLLDPMTEALRVEKARLRAARGELTRAELCDLAVIVLGDPATSAWHAPRLWEVFIQGVEQLAESTLHTTENTEKKTAKSGCQAGGVLTGPKHRLLEVSDGALPAARFREREDAA